MLHRMSHMFLRTLREDPVEAEVASHKLLVRAGYIRRAAPGIYSWLPLGLAVLRKVEQVVREEMIAAGGQEVHFPALLPREPYEATGRWEEYGPNLFRLKDRRENDYLLGPTHEELFTMLVRDTYSSYKDLPLTLFQIQNKYRDEARPRAGLLRGREFIMKDAYSFALGAEDFDKTYQAQRDAYERIFQRLGLPYVIVQATSGAMGGSRSEEFLLPSEVGEDLFASSPGGYAANVEAVTTVVPDPVDASGVGPAHVEDTPDTPTIETLVAAANDMFPRTDRPWEAADTLKNVVVRLDHPDGSHELVVIGIPGDREVDMKRLEAQFSPAEVAAASDEDFKDYPQLVKGYIGPQVLGPNAPQDGPHPRIQYFLDPRVVDGTRWITGANEQGRHVFDLVAGRDFTADGVVESVEILEGDPAPDGSGPLSIRRGIEIGHVFDLGTKYAEVLGLKVLNEQGKQQIVTMGSYGIGVTRIVAALAELNHDDRGIMWPAQVAPAQVHIVIAGKDAEQTAAGEELAAELVSRGLEVILDDRKASPGVKFSDAELLGMPIIVVAGRGVKDGKLEVRLRTENAERQEVEIDQAANFVQELLAAQLQ